MDIRLGYKLVNKMIELSKWLELKAVTLSTRLSMKQYLRENGHL